MLAFRPVLLVSLNPWLIRGFLLLGLLTHFQLAFVTWGSTELRFFECWEAKHFCGEGSLKRL